MRKFQKLTVQLPMELAHPGHWVANLGLEDAFLYVPIYAEHREYLRFYSMGQSYVIPFGESLVPMVFTMALEPGPSGNTGAHQSPSPVGHAFTHNMGQVQTCLVACRQRS